MGASLVMTNGMGVLDARSASGGSAVQTAVDSVRGLIAARHLLPGEQLRQEELAGSLGISRATLREALKALSVEGMVAYSQNRGYTVARFGAEEMRQIYMLRELAEDFVLREIPPAPAAEFERLTQINERMKLVIDDVDQLYRLNDEFHARIFAMSPLRILVAEIDRWWRVSIAYRVLSITVAPERTIITDDHDLMLDALQRGDAGQLVEISRRHRLTSLNRIIPMLA
jgi:DNA-binding GntR family transcriptional regulator